VQGNKVTVGAPFYNRVAIPVALLLLILTAVGPLLAWRKTSFDSLKRNFMWPSIGAVAVMVFLMITPISWGSPFGLRPWQDVAYFYSLMAIGLSVLVTLTIASEYYRGSRVIAGHTGQGMFASMVQLTHRNTRRYGGYIVHFGVVVVIIGLAGSAFNQDKESDKGLGYGDKMRSAATPSSAAPSRRKTNPTTPASGPSSTSSKADARSTRCIPNAASTKQASRPRPCPRFVPP
jgi:cytochrome c-type biogenesis protein CcmF